MAEILTESFCERCGSRYTFESEVPRARLRGVRVLSRGFKNFVLDDKTSIDEAMAAARDDTDRALTAHQLEAFHKTFNFCMQCRQYICPNCWNDADGHCLTCSPVFGHGNLPAPFPDLDPAFGVAPPDKIGLTAAATNGHGHVSDESSDLDIARRLEGLTPTPAPAPEMIGSEVETAAAEAIAAEPVLADAVERTGTETPDEALAAAEVVLEADTVPAVEVHIAEPDVTLDEGFTPEGEPDAIADLVPPLAVVAPLEEPVVRVEDDAPAVVETLSADVESSSDQAGAEPEPETEPEPPVLLLAGLRPGESLDDAIAAFESAAEVPEGRGLPETEVPETVSAVEVAETEVAETVSAVEPPTEVEAPDLPDDPDAVFHADALDDPAITPEAVAFGAVAEPADALWASPAEPSVEIPIAADSADQVPEPEPLVDPLDDARTDAVAAEAVVEAPVESPPDDVAAVAALSLESEWLQPAEAPEPTVEAAPEPTVEAAPEPLLEAAPEPPVEAAPEPLLEAAPEPAPPSAPESPEIAAAASVDVVAQPTWSIVAPEPTPLADAPGPVAEPAVEIAAQGAPVSAQDPDWPAQPQWPSPLPSSGLPFLGRPVVPSGGVEALWAESDRAVTAPQTGTDRPAGGIRPCVSCGLSLSATARFCRRCGTSQVG